MMRKPSSEKNLKRNRYKIFLGGSSRHVGNIGVPIWSFSETNSPGYGFDTFRNIGEDPLLVVDIQDWNF